MPEDNPKCYTVFTRTWWKKATTPGWPNNLEPRAGPRHVLRRNLTYSEAPQMCEKWNREHKPGLYSRKAEFTS